MEGEVVSEEELEDTAVQTEMGIPAVASHPRPELLAETGAEDTEHLGKKELVLSPWLR